MTTTPPQHGDIRVCTVSRALPDHAIVQSVPSIATAKAVHDTLTALLVLQIEHGVHEHPYSVEVQVFSEDQGWTEVFDLTKEI